MVRLLVAALFSLSTVAAQAEFKAGVIDMQKVVQGTAAGKKIKKDLEGEYEKKKKEIKKKEDDFKKRVEEFEKKRQVLSDKVREEQQMELQMDMRKFQEEVQKSQMGMQQKEVEGVKPSIEKIQKVIAEIAKEKDLSVVLEKSERGGVIWAKSEFDITEEVTKRADKK
jgi:outer membrane protein